MNTETPLFMPLPTPDEMRRWDAAAAEIFAIPQLLLMENAGRAALDALRERRELSRDTRIVIIMGRGNNGGDGAVLARSLHDLGCQVHVCYLGTLENLASPVREHVHMARKVGVAFAPLPESGALPLEWREPDVLVDAIVGTGVRGELRERELAAVRSVNDGKAFVLALDIPSGLCGYTGA